ncbi:MAG: mechanosensitive ion channel family protein [Bacteroidales bacterium]
MKTASCLLLAFALAIPAAARAQQPSAAAPPPPADEIAVLPPTAPVIVDGVTLFSVRGVSAFPADQRARTIADNIAAVAADRSVSADSLSIVQMPEVSQIRAGARIVMGVIDADARLEEVSRATLASAYSSRIQTAIRAYRHDREPGVLVRGLLESVGLTALLVAALLVVRWIQRRARSRIEHRFGRHVRDVHIRSFQLVRAERVWRLVGVLLRTAWVLLALVAAYVYLQYVLGVFPWTRGLSRGLGNMVAGPVEVIVQGTIDVVPKLIFLAILAAVTRYLLKVIRLFFDAIASGAVTFSNFDPEWAIPTYRLVRILVIGFAVVVAYPYVPGSQSEAFRGVSLFAGVIFSLGSSSLIGNFIAGYSMTYRRAFRVGDFVKIGEHSGVVENIRLLVTHLRTPKNEEVIVPNSQILGGDVVNYSTQARQGQLILHTSVGVRYETPWRQVEAMLIEAANRTESLLKEPKPFVLQTRLDDFNVKYEINVYCDTPEKTPRHYGDLHKNILDVFNEYGVQIMTPAYEGDTPQPKVVPPAEWYKTPARPADSHTAGV